MDSSSTRPTLHRLSADEFHAQITDGEDFISWGGFGSAKLYWLVPPSAVAQVQSVLNAIPYCPLVPVFDTFVEEIHISAYPPAAQYFGDVTHSLSKGSFSASLALATHNAAFTRPSEGQKSYPCNLVGGLNELNAEASFGCKIGNHTFNKVSCQIEVLFKKTTCLSRDGSAGLSSHVPPPQQQQYQQLPFNELLDLENVLGYRIFYLVHDPTFDLQKALYNHLSANAKNSGRVPDRVPIALSTTNASQELVAQSNGAHHFHAKASAHNVGVAKTNARNHAKRLIAQKTLVKATLESNAALLDGFPSYYNDVVVPTMTGTPRSGGYGTYERIAQGTPEWEVLRTAAPLSEAIHAYVDVSVHGRHLLEGRCARLRSLGVCPQQVDPVEYTRIVDLTMASSSELAELGLVDDTVRDHVNTIIASMPSTFPDDHIDLAGRLYLLHFPVNAALFELSMQTVNDCNRFSKVRLPWAIEKIDRLLSVYEREAQQRKYKLDVAAAASSRSDVDDEAKRQTREVLAAIPTYESSLLRKATSNSMLKKSVTGVSSRDAHTAESGGGGGSSSSGVGMALSTMYGSLYLSAEEVERRNQEKLTATSVSEAIRDYAPTAERRSADDSDLLCIDNPLTLKIKKQMEREERICAMSPWLTAQEVLYLRRALRREGILLLQGVLASNDKDLTQVCRNAGELLYEREKSEAPAVWNLFIYFKGLGVGNCSIAAELLRYEMLFGVRSYHYLVHALVNDLYRASHSPEIDKAKGPTSDIVHRVLFGEHGTGKSWTIELIRDFLSLLSSVEDVSSSSTRSANVPRDQSDVMRVADEMGIADPTKAGSADQSKVDELKHMLSSFELIHHVLAYIDQTGELSARELLLARRSYKIRSIVHRMYLYNSNVLGVGQEGSFLDRVLVTLISGYEFSLRAEAPRSINAIMSGGGGETLKLARTEFTKWMRFQHAVHLAAAKGVALEALPYPCIVMLTRHWQRVEQSLKQLMPLFGGQTRATNRLYSMGISECITRAIQILFGVSALSDLTRTRLQADFSSSSASSSSSAVHHSPPFKVLQIFHLAPLLFLPEDIAIRLITRSLLDNHMNKHCHELLRYMAERHGNYRTWLQSQATPENLSIEELMKAKYGEPRHHPDPGPTYVKREFVVGGAPQVDCNYIQFEMSYNGLIAELQEQKRYNRPMAKYLLSQLRAMEVYACLRNSDGTVNRSNWSKSLALHIEENPLPGCHDNMRFVVSVNFLELCSPRQVIAHAMHAMRHRGTRERDVLIGLEDMSVPYLLEKWHLSPDPSQIMEVDTINFKPGNQHSTTMTDFLFKSVASQTAASSTSYTRPRSSSVSSPSRAASSAPRHDSDQSYFTDDNDDDSDLDDDDDDDDDDDESDFDYGAEIEDQYEQQGEYDPYADDDDQGDYDVESILCRRWLRTVVGVSPKAARDFYTPQGQDVILANLNEPTAADDTLLSELVQNYPDAARDRARDARQAQEVKSRSAKARALYGDTAPLSQSNDREPTSFTDMTDVPEMSMPTHLNVGQEQRRLREALEVRKRPRIE